MMRPADIARVAHEVNRAYCESLGDRSCPPWEIAPASMQESAINGVRFHFANPDAGPAESHENWLRAREAMGWRWGPVKDEQRKEHPCMLPYDHLPAEQRAKDFLFRGVVHALAQHCEPAWVTNASH